MRIMTWEEIDMDWNGLRKKHRMEKASAVARYCVGHTITEVSDYCGPTNPCRDGVCYDDEDRMPYAYKDGGWYGTPWGNLVDEYGCKEGQPCLSEAQPYVTCRGDWCYKVKDPGRSS